MQVGGEPGDNVGSLLSQLETHLMLRGDRKGHAILSSIKPRFSEHEKSGRLPLASESSSAQVLLPEHVSVPLKSPATPNRSAFAVLDGNTMSNGMRVLASPSAAVSRHARDILGPSITSSPRAFKVLEDNAMPGQACDEGPTDQARGGRNQQGREQQDDARNVSPGLAISKRMKLRPRPGWLQAAKTAGIIAASPRAVLTPRKDQLNKNGTPREGSKWPRDEEEKQFSHLAMILASERKGSNVSGHTGSGVSLGSSVKRVLPEPPQMKPRISPRIINCTRCSPRVIDPGTKDQLVTGKMPADNADAGVEESIVQFEAASVVEQLGDNGSGQNGAAAEGLGGEYAECKDTSAAHDLSVIELLMLHEREMDEVEQGIEKLQQIQLTQKEMCSKDSPGKEILSPATTHSYKSESSFEMELAAAAAEAAEEAVVQAVNVSNKQPVQSTNLQAEAETKLFAPMSIPSPSQRDEIQEVDVCQAGSETSVIDKTDPCELTLLTPSLDPPMTTSPSPSLCEEVGGRLAGQESRVVFKQNSCSSPSQEEILQEIEVCSNLIRHILRGAGEDGNGADCEDPRSSQRGQAISSPPVSLGPQAHRLRSALSTCSTGSIGVEHIGDQEDTNGKSQLNDAPRQSFQVLEHVLQEAVATSQGLKMTWQQRLQQGLKRPPQKAVPASPALSLSTVTLNCISRNVDSPHMGSYNVPGSLHVPLQPAETLRGSVSLAFDAGVEEERQAFKYVGAIRKGNSLEQNQEDNNSFPAPGEGKVQQDRERGKILLHLPSDRDRMCTRALELASREDDVSPQSKQMLLEPSFRSDAVQPIDSEAGPQTTSQDSLLAMQPETNEASDAIVTFKPLSFPSVLLPFATATELQNANSEIMETLDAAKVVTATVTAATAEAAKCNEELKSIVDAARIETLGLRGLIDEISCREMQEKTIKVGASSRSGPRTPSSQELRPMLAFRDLLLRMGPSSPSGNTPDASLNPSSPSDTSLVRSPAVTTEADVVNSAPSRATSTSPGSSANRVPSLVPPAEALQFETLDQELAVFLALPSVSGRNHGRVRCHDPLRPAKAASQPLSARETSRQERLLDQANARIRAMAFNMTQLQADEKQVVSLLLAKCKALEEELAELASPAANSSATSALPKQSPIVLADSTPSLVHNPPFTPRAAEIEQVLEAREKCLHTWGNGIQAKDEMGSTRETDLPAGTDKPSHMLWSPDQLFSVSPSVDQNQSCGSLWNLDGLSPFCKKALEDLHGLALVQPVAENCSKELQCIAYDSMTSWMSAPFLYSACVKDLPATPETGSSCNATFTKDLPTPPTNTQMLYSPSTRFDPEKAECIDSGLEACEATQEAVSMRKWAGQTNAPKGALAFQPGGSQPRQQGMKGSIDEHLPFVEYHKGKVLLIL